MPLSDWTVEIFDVAPHKNTAKNPYTGLAIDPDGLTMSVFTMRLTHVPTGKVLERADLTSTPSADAFARYARGVIEVAEQNMAVQKQGETPSPLKGILDVVPVVPEPTIPTQDQLDARAYQEAKHRVAILAELVVADDASLVKAQQALDTAKAAHAAHVKAAADAVVTP